MLRQDDTMGTNVLLHPPAARGWSLSPRTLAVAWTAACAVLGALPDHAAAHEFWLAPSSYDAGAATETAPTMVTAIVGTGFTGDVVPYAAPRVVRWMAIAEGGAVTDLAPRTFNGEIEYALIESGDPGGIVLAFESSFRPIALEAEPFNRYLKTEGLERVLNERRSEGAQGMPGRERYRRCAKTWIRGSDPQRLTHPTGLTMEIVPLTDPSAPPEAEQRGAGKDEGTGFQVLYGGRPAPDLLVRAWRQPRGAAPRDSVGPACSARTDARGIAWLDVAGDGEWLVNAVHMTRSSDPAEADWESTWASLTFRKGREGTMP